MTNSINNRSISSELFKRRVPQILAIYGAGCWTIVQIVEWIINRYLISPHLTDLCLIGMLSFIPSIALIAYFHGTPGTDVWQPIEKIGIPINIIASLLILFIAFYPKDLGAITETIVVEDELGHKIEKIIPKREFRKKITLFHFRNLSQDENKEWIKIGFHRGIILDHADDLMTNIFRGQNHYLADEKDYKRNDELPLNLMLDIAIQFKTKYLLFGDYTLQDSTYIVNTYLYNANTSRLLKGRSYKNRNLFTMIDNISYDLKIDMEIPEQYLLTAKDLPFNEITTKSLNAYREYCKARYCRNIYLYTEENDHLIKALEYDDKFAFAYRDLVFNGFSLNKKIDDLEYYSNMVLKTMHNIPASYQRHAKLVHAKDFEKDPKKVKMILEMDSQLNPDDLNIRVMLADMYLDNGEFNKYIEEIENCYKIEPESYYFLQMINGYNYLRKYQKSLEMATQYINKYPNDDLGYLYASRIYGSTGDFQKQKDYMYKCIIIDPEYIQGECEVDYFSYILNEISFEKLIDKYYSKITRSHTDEDKAAVYWNLGQLYSVHGQIDSAIYCNNQRLSLMSKSFSPLIFSSVQLNLVLFYMNMGRIELAKEIYEKYGSNVGLLAEYDLSQAIFYLFENKHDKAHLFVDDMINKIKNEGKLIKARFSMFIKGLIYLKSKDYENAIITFKELSNYPQYLTNYHSLEHTEDYHINLLISQAYYELTDIKSAKEWIEKAYQLNSWEPRIHYQMALIAYDAGDHEVAMEYLEYCLEIWNNADADFAPYIEAKQKWTKWNQIN